VYPLLGARLNGWQFIATDADATNVDYASANVERNQLTDKVKGKYLQAYSSSSSTTSISSRLVYVITIIIAIRHVCLFISSFVSLLRCMFVNMESEVIS